MYWIGDKNPILSWNSLHPSSKLTLFSRAQSTQTGRQKTVQWNLVPVDTPPMWTSRHCGGHFSTGPFSFHYLTHRMGCDSPPGGKDG